MGKENLARLIGAGCLVATPAVEFVHNNFALVVSDQSAADLIDPNQIDGYRLEVPILPNKGVSGKPNTQETDPRPQCTDVQIQEIVAPLLRDPESAQGNAQACQVMTPEQSASTATSGECQATYRDLCAGMGAPITEELPAPLPPANTEQNTTGKNEVQHQSGNDLSSENSEQAPTAPDIDVNTIQIAVALIIAAGVAGVSVIKIKETLQPITAGLSENEERLLIAAAMREVQRLYGLKNQEKVQKFWDDVDSGRISPEVAERVVEMTYAKNIHGDFMLLRDGHDVVTNVNTGKMYAKPSKWLQETIETPYTPGQTIKFDAAKKAINNVLSRSLAGDAVQRDAREQSDISLNNLFKKVANLARSRGNDPEVLRKEAGKVREEAARHRINSHNLSIYVGKSYTQIHRAVHDRRAEMLEGEAVALEEAARHAEWEIKNGITTHGTGYKSPHSGKEEISSPKPSKPVKEEDIPTLGISSL